MAIQLHKMDIAVEIFEARHRDEMSQGVFIGITPNRINVLRDLIDLEKLKEEYTPGKMIFLNAQGKNIGELDTKHQKKQYGSETIQIKREKISSELRKEAARLGIPVHYGKKLIQLSQDKDKVTVHFADASKAKADFLIACDRAH